MKKGYSLILTLVITSFLVVLGFCLFSVAYSGYQTDKVYSSVSQLRFSARSGAEKAKSYLMLNGLPDYGTLEAAQLSSTGVNFNTYSGTDTINTNVIFSRELPDDADGSYKVKVTSTSTRSGVKKTVTAEYKVESSDFTNDFYKAVMSNAVLHQGACPGTPPLYKPPFYINGSCGSGGGQPGVKTLSFYPTLKPELSNPTTAGFEYGGELFGSNFYYKRSIPTDNKSDYDLFVKANPTVKFSQILSFIYSPIFNNDSSIRMVMVDGNLIFDEDGSAQSLKSSFVFCTGDVSFEPEDLSHNKLKFQKFTICAKNISDPLGTDIDISHSVNDHNDFLKNSINTYLNVTGVVGSDTLKDVTTLSWNE